MIFERATFEIYRAEPTAGITERFESFEVEYGSRTTVLDLLRDIRSYQDGSLAFRMSCRSSICGSCAMRINGYAKLACQTRVAEAVTGGAVVLEPLGIYPVIRDLVVDLDPFWQQNRLITPWLEPKSTLPAAPEREQPMSPTEVDHIKRLGDCILCASCTSSCNSHEVDDKFQGPAALAKSCRFALDPRDRLGAERGSQQTYPRGAYWCCYCNFCTEVCPKDVRPAEAITTLKSLAFSRGLPADSGARRSLAFYDTVRAYGRINEGTLPIRTNRLRAIDYLPLGVHLLRKGKLPTPLMPKIDRYWEVRSIYRNREEAPDPLAIYESHYAVRRPQAGAEGARGPAPKKSREKVESLKLAYYPGCTAETICKELDDSTRAIAPLIGIDLIDIPWSCCGAGTYGEFGEGYMLAMHARVFALCEEAGADLVTVCNTCLVNLAKTNRAFKSDPALLDKANEMLKGTGLAYRGGIEVKHLLWVIADDIGVTGLSDAVKKPLRELRLGPFYGCHVLRPSHALGWESAEEPRSLHSIIKALGASAVDYEGHNRCCGFHILLSKQKTANSMAALRLAHAVEAGCDALVTPCPLCHVALDVYQPPTEKLARQDFGVPVLHMSQMIGLALGLSPKKLGLQRHIVETKAISKAMGLS